MIRPIFILLGFCFCIQLAAQEEKAWWVYFTDKSGTSFDPYSYFAPEAIERRIANGLNLDDPSDFPVNENYLNEVAIRVNQMGYVTRWFNGTGVMATEEQVNELRRLPFVREVLAQQNTKWISAQHEDTLRTSSIENRTIANQIGPMNGEQFAQHDLKGKGVIIAVFDAGFRGTDSHESFQQLRFNNQIRATYDFVRKDANVYGTKADHGTMVLSCIAGTYQGKDLGLAPAATFLLARITNEYGDQFKGEENFVAALEWADKQGAMIINCSGGPGIQSYMPEQMDGKGSVISRAANTAAAKGIFVIVAAGNEGENTDKMLLPPSDADSVFCVTASNDQGYVEYYSSRGPTPDFKRKPDGCAPGTVIVADKTGAYSLEEGTSFSAPLLAGFAACLIQKFPDITPMALADSIHRSASLYPYFDYAHGYGIPQASYFFEEKKAVAPSFTIEYKSETSQAKILIKSKPDCFSNQPAYLYYAFSDEQGRIYFYSLYKVGAGDITLAEELIKKGNVLHVFYQNYYEEKQL
jgi:serine protease AprX